MEVDLAVSINKMSKKRKADESTGGVRYLLIITGDVTSYHSAPLECKSVEKVKHAIENAAQHTLKKDRNAVVGFLALALCARLNGSKVNHFCGREWFADIMIGKSKEIGPGEDFDFDIDTKTIISDEEIGN